MPKFFTPSKLSENIRKTPEGFLFCLDVPIARTGYQIYGADETPLEPDDDGEVEVYRSPEEVFRPQTIASFQGKSVTIQHPEEFVSPKNWAVLSKGVVQNVRRGKEKDENGEECLIADLLITDELGIQLVNSGLREVSCGYDADYEQTGKGRGKQTNIIGNHVALVDAGRAGENYAIKDHRKVEDMDKKKLVELLRKKFGTKVVDEALKESSEDEGAMSYDEMKDWMDEKFQKIETFLQNKAAKDEEESEEKPKPGKKKGEDEEESEDDEGEESAILSRVTALEKAVAKLLEKFNAGDEGEEEEESEDASEEEGAEDSEEKDDDFEESGMTGDAKKRTTDKARAEVLCPGVSKKAKPAELRKAALVGCYKTEDGKKLLDSLTGGKKGWTDALKSKHLVNTLFISASELMRAQAGDSLAGTRDGKSWESGDSATSTDEMTPEKLNALNEKHYAGK